MASGLRAGGFLVCGVGPLFLSMMRPVSGRPSSSVRGSGSTVSGWGWCAGCPGRRTPSLFLIPPYGGAEGGQSSGLGRADGAQRSAAVPEQFQEFHASSEVLRRRGCCAFLPPSVVGVVPPPHHVEREIWVMGCWCSCSRE